MPKGVSVSDDDDAVNFAVSVIPRIGSRAETGIYITMPTISRSSQRLPIYTSIQALNVVPWGSEIISSVSMNDLEGVRRLIGDMKASPQDVDPDNNSLLYFEDYGDKDPALFDYCEERDVDDFNMPETSDSEPPP
ncbi:uncharacterized protein Z519_03344 [Cladophialophora bantiana CBS 173.52]|uniref:Unplaced genomic scaffold supercont1.4, whole genome shotgun sequence n=1 Tax=Cladophialophora bantiana (strain ATCC 10958 / CBS 173.52 / CDC B-1940 / NIH 8579) TaxID=1442370 RepID=A0A0D2F229_CLAB1|nr:uncharacterized protein Z519_03344 [Cladophialophora bantiana CBS 173.52]KIW96276.1 hypothetical protein Z519_03344 [Cladophialophora bantiana CBS 173.52]